MNLSKGRMSVTGRLLGGVAVCAIAATGAFAQSIEDEIVVTAQRQEQSAQDVPIAVSAFGGAELASRQIESFQDIQFNIPNFAFTRTQFTGSSIVLRGIGALAVGASTEPSVSVHQNDIFNQSPRLFETEFFDIERLEILRGPQGTLFGRNATGGVINVITNKASTDGIEGYADAEYGNFNSVKVQGALNLPLSDTLAVRFAGITTQRDGFTENLFDGRDIDDRNIYALRGSARWLPTENTTIDVIANYMREDDSRTRFQKQACEAGPLQPLLGCDPNGPRAFDPQDLRASFLSSASSQSFAFLAQAQGINPALFAPYGLVSLTSPILGQPQPADPRQVNQDTRPQYDAEETIFMLNAKHDFETFSVKLNAGWGNSKIATRTDFDGGVGPELTRPPVLCAPVQFGGLPAVCNLFGGAGGPASFPLSQFDVGITGPDGLVGYIGGNIQDRSSNYRSVDLSIGENDYWSVESIVNTDFDGRFNFLLGARHDESNGYADYAVATTGLDYLSAVGGTLFTAGGAQAAAAAAVLGAGGSLADAQAAGGAAFAQVANTGFGFYTPYFWNDTDDSFLESTSLFGEIYVDITDTLKFTGGIRRNWDTKGVRDRGLILDSFVTLLTQTTPIVGAPPLAPLAVPFGTPSVRGILDPNELASGTPGAVRDFRIIEGDFNSTTGRAVLQWTPTDDAQFYASWTRGFKAGGFNPLTATAANLPQQFAPEVINAYEAGVKSQIGDLQANLTGFYYDYSGLQVSRIVNNTSVNDNIDATVWGIEGEFVYRPVDRLIMNMNASYLNTSIKEFSTFDPRNPTAGDPNAELVRDLLLSSNCVITRGAGDAPLIGQSLPGGLAALNGLIASPFSVCSQFTTPNTLLGGLTPLQAINGALGTSYDLVAGIDQDLSGNELPGAPEFKISGGVQYEIGLGENYSMTPRVDAFYQTDFVTNIFNSQQDVVDAYAYVNAQVTFGPTEGNWTARFFMQNVTNNDAITGIFDVGQGAGNFQNLFLLEPRRWGFGINMVF